MRVDLPVEVRKVQTFSRVARRICMAFLVLLALGMLLGLVAILFGLPGPKVGFGPYKIDASHLTTPFLKGWSLLFVGVCVGLALRWAYLLYALFDSLATGIIFTSENVRLIRRIGFVMVYMLVLVPLFGLASLAVLNMGLVDEASVIRVADWSVLPSPFMGVFGPGLVLLLSWIMEVGRKTRDEADAMRRETELVV